MMTSQSRSDPNPLAPSTPGEWSPPVSLVEAVSGDTAVIGELIDAFHADTDGRIRQIQAALTVTEFDTIRSEAHSIKGGARQLGADALANACQQLETLCQMREAPIVAAGLRRVQQLYTETLRAMAAYSARPGPDSSATSLT